MILEARDLTRHFAQARGLWRRPGVIRAVDGVSLAVPAGSCFGVVGESGSGKSTLGRLLLGLMRPSGGSVHALGADLNRLSSRHWRAMRRDLALVHQNPRGALDPRMAVGTQILEPLAIHEPPRDRAQQAEALAAAMQAVGLPENLARLFPHHLSGGQRQRVVLARALALRPKLMVLDEPTSALDVSVQAQIMALLGGLKARFGLTYVFITHDLRNLRRIADTIAVLYAGRIVEIGPAADVCQTPLHPYARALVAAVPRLHRGAAAAPVKGEPPDPAAPPAGCRFHPRCALAVAQCARLEPRLREIAPGRLAACHLAEAT